MVRCPRCNKELPYEQVGVNFLWYRTENDMSKEEKNAYTLYLSDDYKELRFFQNFGATLCYNCSKDLENNLYKFFNIENEEEK